MRSVGAEQNWHEFEYRQEPLGNSVKHLLLLS